MAIAVLLFVSSADAQVLLGIRYGSDGFAMQDVRNLETWQGKRNATVMMFTNFCPTVLNSVFNTQLPNIWNGGNVPILSWQPYACSGSTTPNNIDALIANGSYDSYLQQFASLLKTFIAGPDGALGTADDRRVYIRLAHEMNGDWYPWSATTNGVTIGAGNTVADYIAMWQRVHNIVESAGITQTQVQWIFCPNATDATNSHPMENYYPGDAYVDWVGIDGYNFGGSHWISPSDRFTIPFSRIKALAPGKPLSIPEFGTVADTLSGINIAAKNQWILDAFKFFAANSVKLACYFNRHLKHDWIIFGVNELGDTTFTINGVTYNVFSAYKTAVSSSSYVSSDRSNPRLLTDTQFLGQTTATTENLATAALTAAPTSGTAPLPVMASTLASSSPGGIIVSTSIDFGDGTLVQASSATHTYKVPGTYAIKATVVNNYGSTATATAAVKIWSPNVAPLAVLTISPSTSGPLTFNASTSGSTDPDGSIAAVTINFGDGTIMNSPSATHTYAGPGKYVVTATVRDNQGASAQATATIYANRRSKPRLSKAQLSRYRIRLSPLR